MLLHSIAAIVAVIVPVTAQVDYSQYVNPFIGGSGPIPGQAYGGGDIFVGASMPFGVVKFGIDTYEPNVSISTINGGYTPKGLVTGISLMHESGTGGAPKYGTVSQMPLTAVDGSVNILDNRTYWQERVGDEVAKVGYYSANLNNSVSFELSASYHASVINYEFPQDSSKYILVDTSHYLPSEKGAYDSQYCVDGEITLEDDGSYTGYTTTIGGFNEGGETTQFFCGSFETPPDQSQLFWGRNTFPTGRYYRTLDGEPIPQPTFSNATTLKAGPLSNRVGALFTWNETSSTKVNSKIGLSFISAEKACMFRDSEITSWSVNDTVKAAVDVWNKDVFSTIQVPTGPSANQTLLRLLYSSMYFMHLMPSDRSGENPLWDSGEPSYDDFYTMWDIFRCTTSLYHLIQPSRYEDMIRSVIDIWKYDGFMPDGRSGNYNGISQGGSDADNVLADAYIKGLRGAINWTEGYMAMKKDAEVQPYNTYSNDDMLGSVKEGRGALYDWIPLGYVSYDRSTRCISRTAEYSLNDFALSQVAAGEMPQDRELYLNRSAGWQSIWNHNVTSRGFTGFMSPRNASGRFNETFDPTQCGDCEWMAVTYEAVPWEYSFSVPHDLSTLIDFMGGPSEFERRLDYIFMPNTSGQDLGENGASITTIMNIGNEPDFGYPYYYHYLNKQYKSVNQSRALAKEFFHDAPYGVPGNSDAGALNSWLIWQMIGLYPVVTQPVYLLNSPWFEDINMTVNHNKTVRITATNLNDESYFVQGVKINGKQWDRNWFVHDDLMNNGGTIEFTLGSNMTIWENGDVPPSPGHVEL